MGLTGIKIKAYPTSKQARTLSQWMGCARFVYNAKCDDDFYYRKFLSQSLSLTGEKIPIDCSYSPYKTELTPWLSNCPSQILRNSVHNWYEAYQRFFEGLAGRPKRKKKSNHGSIYLTSELFCFEDGKLFIGTKTNNIGYLSIEPHRDFQPPKSITISRHNNKWYVSFCYQDGKEKPKDPKEILAEMASQSESYLNSITEGLDRGVVIPLQTATGNSYDFTPQQKASITKQQKKIKQQQRKLSRQEKDSQRRNKTKLAIAKSHDKLANIRKDFAHQTSHKLVVSDQEIFIAEDLKVKNMMATPKAKQDEQGHYLPNKAKAKAGLNGAILQSAWGAMILYIILHRSAPAIIDQGIWLVVKRCNRVKNERDNQTHSIPACCSMYCLITDKGAPPQVKIQ